MRSSYVTNCHSVLFRTEFAKHAVSKTPRVTLSILRKAGDIIVMNPRFSPREDGLYSVIKHLITLLTRKTQSINQGIVNWIQRRTTPWLVDQKMAATNHGLGILWLDERLDVNKLSGSHRKSQCFLIKRRFQWLNYGLIMKNVKTLNRTWL